MIKILLVLTFSFQIILAQSVIWEDDMNGNNSIAGLQARDWVVLNVDGGGITAAFYQGVPSLFNSFEGPDSGYAAANWLGANNQGEINHWLISPSLQIMAGDTLFFYARRKSPNYPDSIYILYSENAGTTPADFSNLGGFLLNTEWQLFTLSFSTTGTHRFAVDYYMTDSSKAYYIGLDYFRLLRWPISLNKTFTFGDITRSSSYRMIGIPGMNDFLISGIITGEQNKDWKVYFDNGAASDYLIPYNGSSAFNIRPGKGFWVLSKNDVTFSNTVNAVPIAIDNTFSISLHDGWNIISNPFEKDVAWSDVQQQNGLGSNDVIWKWDGSWASTPAFSTFSGFYFFNINNAPSLKIPYPAPPSLGKKSEQIPYNINPDANLNISLVQNGITISESIINFEPKSSNDFDSEDYFIPPGDFDDARINLYNKNLSTSYNQLFIESRPAINNGQSFGLSYKNTTGNDINLKIKGIENFQNYEVYLLDKDLNQFHNLRQQSTILIKSSIKKRDYNVLIGSSEFINSLKTDLMPHKFSLYQNYPNPFNPTTTIRFALPDNADVTINVYNVLGELVNVLINNKEYPAGYYEVELTGSSLSSGVYMYMLKAGNFTETKKMVLLK